MVYALFAESHFAESHFAECMGHFAKFFFGKVGIEIRQSGQSSCLLNSVRITSSEIFQQCWKCTQGQGNKERPLYYSVQGSGY